MGKTQCPTLPRAYKFGRNHTNIFFRTYFGTHGNMVPSAVRLVSFGLFKGMLSSTMSVPSAKT